MHLVEAACPLPPATTAFRKAAQAVDIAADRDRSTASRPAWRRQKRIKLKKNAQAERGYCSTVGDQYPLQSRLKAVVRYDRAIRSGGDEEIN
mmetsp:Transcript_2482/g.5714  ORF Transcript_2482/g.5714 Transcript_2482/m.5714 type:complete len:92 (+) Transcript_2482:819-1094(+)